MNFYYRTCRFLIWVFATLMLVCTVCTPTSATCSDSLEASPSHCCCQKKTSATEKSHRCCQQKTQFEQSDDCKCQQPFPPADFPKQQNQETRQENLIVVGFVMRHKTETLHGCHPHFSQLRNESNSHLVPLNLSLCVWLT